MFGVVALEPIATRELLRDAPRSLRALSREHPDGWGVAIHDAHDWVVHRSTSCAADCARYGELAEGIATRLLVAHIRQKTVGATALANTHPFRRGAFVFAHNGTIKDVAALVARSSPERLAQIEGDTDSERLFAFVMTHVDDACDVERGVARAVQELHAFGDIGSASFLLSCGERLYAHRLGRSLFVLIRSGAVVIASEQLTGEAWQELPERTVVVVDHAAPQPRPLAA
ncbi:class II glutamine amidotransferase [soil metagenome]